MLAANESLLVTPQPRDSCTSTTVLTSTADHARANRAAAFGSPRASAGELLGEPDPASLAMDESMPLVLLRRARSAAHRPR